uniref:ATP synthase complex subunit 8 n=1 Tax=Leptobrachium liui TaxID=265041 RepID=A0A891GU27_9ANUR|nr:ATP synthase F0 subunit 8 [Leptobrachium liui]QRK25760.1 ATP synthase F0 subunit 8 [Leptobrachium liui]
MPQLITAPWFFILLFSWLTFFFIFSSKMKKINPVKDPYSALIFMPEIYHWPWSWHSPWLWT